MTCPRCKGYLWPEQERSGEYRECCEKYGLEIVCIGGHRFTLTPEDYRRWELGKIRNNKLGKRRR